jgi:hypothetical protein
VGAAVDPKWREKQLAGGATRLEQSLVRC